MSVKLLVLCPTLTDLELHGRGSGGLRLAHDEGLADAGAANPFRSLSPDHRPSGGEGPEPWSGSSGYVTTRHGAPCSRRAVALVLPP